MKQLKFQSFWPSVEAEANRNQVLRRQNEYDHQDFSWHNQFFGGYQHHPMGIIGHDPPKYMRVIELASSVSEPLQIDAISYASPGWIQIIGDWNLLKVLADFISKWRAENTKRDTNRLKAQNERLRIQAELAAKILEQAPKMERHYEGGTSRLIELAEEVIRPTRIYIQSVGSDARIISAEIVSPGQS